MKYRITTDGTKFYAYREISGHWLRFYTSFISESDALEHCRAHKARRDEYEKQTPVIEAFTYEFEL